MKRKPRANKQSNFPKRVRKMMKPEELRAKYGGVVAFPVTPFRDDLSLDIEGLRQNLTRLMNHPVCAVVAAGGTGESIR